METVAVIADILDMYFDITLHWEGNIFRVYVIANAA